MQKFDSYHIVTAHYERQYDLAWPALGTFLKAKDAINDIRRYLDKIGAYVGPSEWPTFIERFCTFNIEGDINLDRKKFLASKEMCEQYAARLLGEELQHRPEIIKKLEMIMKSEAKAQGQTLKPRPMENHWAS